jgi:signal transduction histidine kinase
LTRLVTELRLSIFDLRANVGASGGLGSALSEHARNVGRQSGITVHLTLNEAPNRLTPAVETELLRIAQEAITNARKHSAARNIWIECQVEPPAAHIQIRDDGRGLGVGRHDSFGLKIMRERADRIGARLRFDCSPEGAPRGGTCVTITLDKTMAPILGVSS